MPIPVQISLSSVMRGYNSLQDAHVRTSGWSKVTECCEQGSVPIARHTFRAHASGCTGPSDSRSVNGTDRSRKDKMPRTELGKSWRAFDYEFSIRKLGNIRRNQAVHSPDDVTETESSRTPKKQDTISVPTFLQRYCTRNIHVHLGQCCNRCRSTIFFVNTRV